MAEAVAASSAEKKAKARTFAEKMQAVKDAVNNAEASASEKSGVKKFFSGMGKGIGQFLVNRWTAIKEDTGAMFHAYKESMSLRHDRNRLLKSAKVMMENGSDIELMSDFNPKKPHLDMNTYLRTREKKTADPGLPFHATKNSSEPMQMVETAYMSQMQTRLAKVQSLLSAYSGSPDKSRDFAELLGNVYEELGNMRNFQGMAAEHYDAAYKSYKAKDYDAVKTIEGVDKREAKLRPLPITEESTKTEKPAAEEDKDSRSATREKEMSSTASTEDTPEEEASAEVPGK